MAIGNTNDQCVKGDNCSFRHDMNKRGKVTPSNPSPNSFMQQSERKSSRTRSPRGRSPSGRTSRWPCKDYLEGTCNNSFCGKWHLPECLFYKTKIGCRFGEKCSFAHRQVDEQLTNRSITNNDKSAVAMLKKGDWHDRCPVTDQCHDRPVKPEKRSDKKLGQNSSKRQSSDARQLGCVFQSRHDAAEVYSPEMHRHAEANPTCEIHKGYCTSYQNSRPKSFARIYLPGWTSSAKPQRSKNWGSVTRRDRVARCPRSGVEDGQKCVKLKEHESATFFSLSENRCLPASTLKPGERELVVDSRASMHKISKKDLSDAEMDTFTKPCSPPTIVIIANGEVETHEEATLYVKN